MNRNFLKLFLLLSSICLSQSAFAATTFLTCNDCTNSVLYAKQMTNSMGQSTVHVGDFINEVLTSYKITVTEKQGPGETIILKTALQITSPSNMLSDFNGIILRKNQALNASKDLEFPDHIIDSVWDLYGDQQLQTQVRDWYLAQGHLSDLASYAGNITSGITNFSVPIVITFTNNAVITLAFKRVYQSGGNTVVEYEIDLENSKDSHGNAIVFPIQGNPATGTAAFGNGTSDLVSFIRAATTSGYSYSSGGSGGSVTCTLKGTVLICTYHNN